MGGPLSDVRIVEFGAIGPAPFACMLLGDLGAEIVRIDRVGGGEWPEIPVLNRNRAVLELDLKDGENRAYCLEAIAAADVLVEGFRPGVMEKLGLGPDVVHARAPQVIYGRMTGWGQDGPLAHSAGHDINYLALAGALSLLGGPGGHPAPPLNLLGDYAAGALYLVMGILAALHERGRSGLGQVIDAAIVDGTASLLAPIIGMAAAKIVDLDPSRNFLSGFSAPFYRTYRCADGAFLAVGPLEERFRKEMCRILDVADLGTLDPQGWPADTGLLADIFASRTRDEWAAAFEGTDACVTPVLSLSEAPYAPHLEARSSYVDGGEILQPAPAPRFSRTPGEIRWSDPARAPGGVAQLESWGVRRARD